MAEQTLTLKLKVNDDGSTTLDSFTGKLKGLEKASKDINLIKWDSLINLGERALRAGERIYNLTKETAAFGDEIVRNAKTLGITTQKYQELQYMAMRSDVEVTGLSMGMRQLTMSMDEAARGTGEGAQVFKALGISIYDSTGKMKTLDVMMGELAERFSKFIDGPEKSALALKIFGSRVGEQMISYLNQGKEGLRGLREEFERLGLAISEETLKALSKADEAFERFGAKFKILKTKVLAPVVSDFENLIDQILKLVELVERIGKGENISEAISKTIGNRQIYLEGRMGLGILTPEEFEELQKLRRPEIKVSATTPTIRPPAMGKEERIKGMGGGIGWEDVASGIVELSTDYERIISQQRILEDDLGRLREIQERLNEIEGKRAEQLADDMFPSQEKVNRRILQAEDYSEKLRVQLFQMQQLVKDYGWEDYAAGADASTEAIRQLNRMVIENSKTFEKTISIGETLAQRMGEAWNFNIKNIISNSKSMGDAVRNVFYGMADSFSSAVSRMINDWILFGNITGQYKVGEGLIGKLGGLLGGIFERGIPEVAPSEIAPFSASAALGYQHGGWINEPIFGIGKSGKRYTFGEGGPELVTPKGGGNIYNYNYYIDARGAEKGVEARLIRMIRQSQKEAVIQSVNAVADNKMRGGRFAKIFE